MKTPRQGNRHTEHRFAQAPQAKIQRSQFNRSHKHITTLNSGMLVPIMLDEVLPGDTYNLSMTAFGRLTTTIWPILDNMYADFFLFFLPEPAGLGQLGKILWTTGQPGRFRRLRDSATRGTRNRRARRSNGLPGRSARHTASQRERITEKECTGYCGTSGSGTKIYKTPW